MDDMQVFLPAIGILIFLFFFSFFVTSLIENENRAAFISIAAGVIIPVPFLIPFFSYLIYPAWLDIALIVLFILPILLVMIPVKMTGSNPIQIPQKRYDERDTMFSRRSLKPGTDLFEEYYKRNPDKTEPDARWRGKPGLLKAGSKYYDPVLFAAADSIFEKVDKLQSGVEGEIAQQRIEVDSGNMSKTLKKMVLGWGAHSFGITELRDYHIYSIGGRGDRYGKVFFKDHQYAIVLTVEMDHSLMKSAPAAPTILESARQYLNAGTMAVQLADFIRSLGYPARAHIDANYKVICPLVAKDVGLGEIGRLGLLMTPKLGPRIRIAIVTTDLPLTTSKCQLDPTIIDFCRHCRKCASVCPVKSIPFESRRNIDGVKRWQINSESCYTFWCIAGTDCGKCVIVCPYSHPDNWIYQLVRFGTRNSLIFRRMAVKLDDLFYGRR